MPTLRDRLKRTMDQHGLTARQLSLAAGLNKGYVGDVLAHPERSPSVAAIEGIARVLHVSPGGLVEGDSVRRGMGESHARPWEPATPGQRPDLAAFHRQLARGLTPDARQPATLELTRGFPTFGYLAGDVVVIDLKRAPQDGDLVVCTLMDWESGAQTTLVRLWLDPFLVSADPNDPQPKLVHDGQRVAVKGPILASFRAPAVTARS